MGAGTLQNRSAKRCISSGIEVDLTVQSGENTIFVTAQRKGSFHGMTLRMEEQRFLTAELCLYRNLVFPGSQCCDMLDGNIFFSTKTAADQLVFHHNTLRLPAKHNGGLFSRIKRTLIGA